MAGIWDRQTVRRIVNLRCVQKAAIEPGIFIIRRNQKAPTRRKAEIRNDCWASFSQMGNVHRLEELRIG